MRSDDRSNEIDLETDLPTTKEDVEALRRVRTDSRQRSLAAYLYFLAQFPARSPEELRAKGGAHADRPFDLLDGP